MQRGTFCVYSQLLVIRDNVGLRFHTETWVLTPKCYWIFDEMSYSNKMDLFQYFKVGLWNYIELNLWLYFVLVYVYVFPRFTNFNMFYFATEMSFYTRSLILNQKKINCNNYEFGIFAVHKK